jgi:superfamily II DNA or RNA helicase
MNRFPPDTQFCFPWRPYQARVLAELSEHLDDDRLNVIAPPGSGKTVLGLEVVRRLNQPTLILSPTITIRDQWVDRFVQLFLPALHVKPDWISFDLTHPAFLTVSTYQGLHSLHTGGAATSESEDESEVLSEDEDEDDADDEDDEDDHVQVRRPKSKKQSRNPFAPLRRAGIQTIVVDEAHHLKNAWWRSLTALRATLKKPVVVSLTATPPYDVSRAEWSRYKTLCGPVDSQIGVPELLLEKNLCPHQDYVYFSLPAPDEAGPIGDFREAVRAFREELLLDFDFIDAVESHPWMMAPEDHFEAIFERTEVFSAMLIFLNAVDRWISQRALDALGVQCPLGYP